MRDEGGGMKEGQLPFLFIALPSSLIPFIGGVFWMA
jgi:hypothetical protein